MQLGTVLPEFEKCLTMQETLRTSMDSMAFGKDHVVAYLSTTFAAFSVKQQLLQHMNLWSSFFTSIEKKNVLSFP